MSFTNAQLAQQIADLITYWSSFNEEYSDWLGGTVDGGPGSDGKYPLTNWAGAESLVESPAKLADNVSGYVGLASASETAAAASAAAALTSENNASTSASTATAQAALADADRVAAELAESNAASSQTVATAQANLATDRAGYAQEWAITVEDTLVSVAAGGNGTTDYSSLHHAAKSAASASAASTSETGASNAQSYAEEWANKAHNVLVSAAAGGDQVDDYSALHWATEAATFNPALYAALADNETITGNYTFQMDTIGDFVFRRNGTTGAAGVAFRNDDAVIKGYIGFGDDSYFKIWKGADTSVIFTITDTGDITQVGSITATGAVTGSNLNVSNWDTAYGWGDHAGLYSLTSHNHAGVYEPADATILKDADIGVTVAAFAHNHSGVYEPVDASLVRSGTLTQEDNYTYLNRNNASNPVLHVAQVGAGPIARFGKAPSLGSTAYTAEITFGSDGAITAEGLTVNDVTQTARLNIIHSTSGNTHFNWSSNGENYITHKNTGFTRFRGFDGVSTYTTRAEMSDADFEIHLLTKVNSQILAGSGYGSAGTPSFSSTQDANTGMYVSASDTLGFSTGGIERVKINSSGLTMTGAGSDVILGNNSLTANNVSSSVGAAPLKIGTGTGTPMVWGQYCALGRTYSAARTGLANNAYVDSDDAVSGQWRHLVTHGSYGHTILELAGGAYYFYGNSNSVTSGAIVSKNQIAQLDSTNGFKVTGTGNANPGTSWSSLSKDMLHLDGKEVIDGNDTWLRINQNGDFSNGCYLPYAWSFNSTMKRYNKGAYLFHQSSSYNASGAGGITFSTSAASGGVSGDIWFQYT